MILNSILIAGAVGATSLAGVPGGGGNTCHLTWDKQCCPVPGCNVSIAPGILSICNEKPDSAEFTWQLVDTSGMGLQFLPESGVATPGNAAGIGVPGDCIDIPFTVICPPNFPVGSVADYMAIVTKVGTNETFTCSGNVVNNSDWKLDPVGDPVIDVDIPAVGTPAPSSRGQLLVSNLGSSGKDGVSIYVEPMGPFDVVPSLLLVPPIGPGSSWSVDSFFDITYRVGPGNPPSGIVMGDILFMIDTTGDGAGDTVIGSQTVRAMPAAAPCLGDINGDGVIDTADLGIVLGAFGTMCP